MLRVIIFAFQDWRTAPAAKHTMISRRRFPVFEQLLPTGYSKRLRRNRRPLANADPDVLRQRLQWQFVTAPSSPSILYLIPPHRHEPLSIEPPTSVRRN